MYLEVSELQRRGGLGDGVGSLLQRSAGLLLALRRDHLVISSVSILPSSMSPSLHHLSSGFSGGLGLGGHGALEVLGQPHVLDLHPVHVHTPGVRRLLL